MNILRCHICKKLEDADLFCGIFLEEEGYRYICEDCAGLPPYIYASLPLPVPLLPHEEELWGIYES